MTSMRLPRRAHRISKQSPLRLSASWTSSGNDETSAHSSAALSRPSTGTERFAAWREVVPAELAMERRVREIA